MKKSTLLLGAAALFLFLRSRPVGAVVMNSGSQTLPYTTGRAFPPEVQADPLVSGNYSNEQQLFQAVATAPNAEVALQRAGLIANGIYSKSPYDVEYYNAVTPQSSEISHKIKVSQKTYDNKARYVANVKKKIGSIADGAQKDYLKNILRNEQAELASFVVV